jgi:predicted phosphatase
MYIYKIQDLFFGAALSVIALLQYGFLPLALPKKLSWILYLFPDWQKYFHLYIITPFPSNKKMLPLAAMMVSNFWADGYQRPATL